MWPLLSLLFSSTIVTAAPHRHGLQHRQWHVSHNGGLALSRTAVPVPSVAPTSVWVAPSYETITSSSIASPWAPAATPVYSSPPSTPPSGDTTLRLGSISRMSSDYASSICHICHDAAIAWPLPATPDGIAMPMPALDDVDPEQPSLFPVPESTPNKLTVVNYCPYDIYYEHLAGAATLGQGTLSANGGSCSEATTGTVFKVGKTAVWPLNQPVQIEYGGNFYDLSMIDCLARAPNGERTADTTACAGHEYGLQLSSPGARAWQCDSNAWCDDQAYFYEENLCKRKHPNTTTKTGDFRKGLTMEFCASLKPAGTSY